MSAPSEAQRQQLQLALSEFIGAFEVVFRYDWEYTTLMIDPGASSFLEPGVKDESEDWGARGALLEKYRNLVKVMKECGLKPVFPFPLEHLPGSPKALW
jgi:hypothetical protein